MPEALPDTLIVEPDYEWLMIDASHCKVHPHAAGARGGNEDISRTKKRGRLNTRYTWPRHPCAHDAHGMPLRVIATEGTRADCKQAYALIDGLSAKALLADRGYDTNEIVEAAVRPSIKPAMEPSMEPSI